MKKIEINPKVITENSWPRNLVKSVETRKRDIVIRIADWTKYREEPAYDVEVYNRGVYDWTLSKVFSVINGNKTEARLLAVAFAQSQIAKLLA